MFKRILAIVISAMLLLAASGLKVIHAQSASESPLAEKARVDVAKRGVGRDARVEVKLRNNNKVKGYISEAGVDTFIVTDRETGAASTVTYADVLEVKKKGGGLSAQTKWIIGGAVAAGAAITLYVVRGAFCDGQC